LKEKKINLIAKRMHNIEDISIFSVIDNYQYQKKFQNKTTKKHQKRVASHNNNNNVFSSMKCYIERDSLMGCCQKGMHSKRDKYDSMPSIEVYLSYMDNNDFYRPIINRSKVRNLNKKVKETPRYKELKKPFKLPDYFNLKIDTYNEDKSKSKT
jgi:hypothetical protein